MSIRLRDFSAEWPTWLLLAVIYTSWLLLALFARALNPWLWHGAMTLVVAWYMSLQHELLHGHPTRSARVNRWLGLAPLAVWYPYDLYRQTHLAHHREDHLTYPGIDPESNYLAPALFDRLPWLLQPAQRASRTAFGRVLIGPVFAIIALAHQATSALWHGPAGGRRLWLWHGLAVLALLLWLDRICAVLAWRYLLGVAWPALGLAMLRSLYEHRPAAVPAHRVVINEAGWFWRLLYLNNNYHAVHHAHPALPWYRIGTVYHEDRAGYLFRNGGFLVPGYGYLLRHHALTPVDPPVYPALRVGV